MNFNFIAETLKTASPGIVAVVGSVVTSTSGTISSSNIPGGGASIAKTGGKNGRYTVTLAPPSGVGLTNLTFLGGFVTLIGPDDAALTAGKGTKWLFRDDDISTTGAKDGTIEIQFTRNNGTTDDNDTEVQDGASFTFCLFIGTPAVT